MTFYSLAASTILGIAYGIDVQEENDPYVDAAERALVSLGLGIAPGAFLVESIPALKYVPEWFPGPRSINSCYYFMLTFLLRRCGIQT